MRSTDFTLLTGVFFFYIQVDDVKGELLERYKVLPALSSRLSDLENQNDELREKNRQMEQKLATMQVILVILVILAHPAVKFVRLNTGSVCPGDTVYLSLIGLN